MDAPVESAEKDTNSRLRIGSRDKDVSWYTPDLVALTEAQ